MSQLIGVYHSQDGSHSFNFTRKAFNHSLSTHGNIKNASKFMVPKSYFTVDDKTIFNLMQQAVNTTPVEFIDKHGTRRLVYSVHSKVPVGMDPFHRNPVAHHFWVRVDQTDCSVIVVHPSVTIIHIHTCCFLLLLFFFCPCCFYLCNPI